MIWPHQPGGEGKRALILGSPGTGKTWYAYHYLFKHFDGLRVFIDPKPERYVQGESVVTSLKEFERDIQQKPDIQEIIFKGKYGEDFKAKLEEFIRYLNDWKSNDPYSPLLICYDEYHQIGSKMKVFVDGADMPVLMGRSQNIHAVVISQHSRVIGNDIILAADQLILFGEHPIMIKYFTDTLGVDLNENDLQKLRTKGTGILWEVGQPIRYVDAFSGVEHGREHGDHPKEGDKEVGGEDKEPEGEIEPEKSGDQPAENGLPNHGVDDQRIPPKDPIINPPDRDEIEGI